MMIKEHDPLCPEHPDWGFSDSECKCLWIRVGRSDERTAWILWAVRRACCDAGLTAAPDPCTWHDKVYLTNEPDVV
jgi:hypothetical protein